MWKARAKASGQFWKTLCGKCGKCYSNFFFFFFLQKIRPQDYTPVGTKLRLHGGKEYEPKIYLIETWISVTFIGYFLKGNPSLTFGML